MNKIIIELLEKLEKNEKKYGGSIFNDNEKANDEEIEYFNNWFKKLFKKGFLEYIEFIKTINGFNNNGLYVYSINKKCDYSIYELNETWWDANDELMQYIFFGDSDISLYCKNVKKEKYYVLDKGSGSVMEEYEIFDEIMVEALKIAL